jgi:demethylsterigmatocystin 6-O-methyltransferase
MSADSIRQLAKSLPDDAEARLDIYRAARELMLRAEPPRETCFRLFWSNGAAAAGVIAVELGMFRLLATEPKRVYTIQEVSDTVGAEPSLVVRLLRTLAAWGTIAQIGPDGFQATNNTIALTTLFAEGAAQVQTQFSGPIFLALPSYLKKTGYRNPSDTSNTAFHQAYNTQMDIFDWFGANPEWSNKVMSFMGVQRQGQLPWMPQPQFLQGFDIALTQHDIQRQRALFVDVGGAVGHQCIAFRESHPELNGAVILQDLPFIADLARKNPRIAQLDVTIQPHDFLTPQTPEAQGAKIFYIRNVLHDWNDAKNLVILKHIGDALADDSLLIIDEAIVPDVDVAIPVVAYDMVMMAMPAAQERSEGMWRDLVERQAGLKIREIRTYDKGTCDGLIFITKR